MGALGEFASDVNDIVADLELQAGSLNARKVKLKERGTDVLGRWAQHFTTQEAALTAAEAALNRISNVPLSTVSPATPTSGPISEIPVVKP